MEIILLKLLSKGDEIKVVYVLEHPDNFGAELIEKSRPFMSEQRLKKIFFSVWSRTGSIHARYIFF